MVFYTSKLCNETYNNVQCNNMLLYNVTICIMYNMYNKTHFIQENSGCTYYGKLYDCMRNCSVI